MCHQITDVTVRPFLHLLIQLADLGRNPSVLVIDISRPLFIPPLIDQFLFNYAAAGPMRVS